MQVLLALGANLPSKWGSPFETISKAIADLSEWISEKVRIAPFYVSPAEPNEAGPVFVNTAMALETEKKPNELLEICHNPEREVPQLRNNRRAPRTLDIDLIACEQTIMPDAAVFESWRSLPMGEQATKARPGLILPHPRLQDWAFGLAPINDIAPDWRHPGLGLISSKMLAALPAALKAALKRLETP